MPRLIKGSWIDTYIDFCYHQESPILFHKWVATCVISAALGRHVFLDRMGKYTIFPNLFVILVAKSAQCKKSTSIGIGERMLSSIVNPPITFAQKITPEALIQTLAEGKDPGGTAGFICADELSVFMGKDAIQSGIIPILTSLYDSKEKWTYRTRARGNETLTKTTITILAGTTRDALKECVPEQAIGGGFTSRVIFVIQDKSDRPILFHTTTPEEISLKKQLINDLDHIKENVKGEVTFSPEAMTTANIWYEQEWKMTRDSRVEGYFARKHDTMFKVATILCVAESDSLIIQVSHIRQALAMLEETEKNLEGALTSATMSPIGSSIEAIYNIVKSVPGISHSDILRKCWRMGTSQELNLMIRTLMESEEIVGESNGKTICYTIRRKT